MIVLSCHEVRLNSYWEKSENPISAICSSVAAFPLERNPRSEDQRSPWFPEENITIEIVVPGNHCEMSTHRHVINFRSDRSEHCLFARCSASLWRNLRFPRFRICSFTKLLQFRLWEEEKVFPHLVTSSKQIWFPFVLPLSWRSPLRLTFFTSCLSLSEIYMQHCENCKSIL